MAARGRIVGLGLAMVLLSGLGAASPVANAAGSLGSEEPREVTSPSVVLTASDGFAGDGFGHAVDVDGDSMVVGAIGAAYVFTRVEDEWVETAKLTVPNLPSGTRAAKPGNDPFHFTPVEGQEIHRDQSGTIFGGFGRSVAASGDVIVVGAYEAAYVFTLVEGNWVEMAKLMGAVDLSGLEQVDEDTVATGKGSTQGFLEGGFGASVSVDGEEVVVGVDGVIRFPGADAEAAPDDKSESKTDYVFTRSGDQWVETARVVRPNGQQDDNFGGTVALDGDQFWTALFANTDWKIKSVAVGGGVIAVGAHLSFYEPDENLVWRTIHKEPGAVHVFNANDADDDSSDDGIDPTWIAVFMVGLVLIAIVVAYFIMGRRPRDGTGRYTT